MYYFINKGRRAEKISTLDMNRPFINSLPKYNVHLHYILVGNIEMATVEEQTVFECYPK